MNTLVGPIGGGDDEFSRQVTTNAITGPLIIEENSIVEENDN